MTTKPTTTPDRAKATPGPWRDPYVDQLPNGLRAVRIDSAQATGVSVIALLPIGDGSDLEINAIQHANARLIAGAQAMREALEHADITITNILQLCGSTRLGDTPRAKLQIERDRIRALIARIDGEGV